jgi:hypothetical protein
MTDHAEAFDESKLHSYVNECQSLSSDYFRIVPGLEYECQARMHILGYGMTSRLETKDPQQVIERINRAGGISVIAHPPERVFQWIESFGHQANGIEVWNTKYDGRYAPRPSTFALLGRLQTTSQSVHAYYGLDLHWKHQYSGLLNHLDCASLSNEQILGALASGSYYATNRTIELPSNGKLTEQLLSRFAVAQARSSRCRSLVQQCTRTLDQVGIRLPSPIKSQLRALF